MNDSILEKIKKLLNLAGDANPSREEAALALSKAQELMLLHEIDVLDLKDTTPPDEFSKHFVGTPYNRAPAPQKFICWLLQNHFHVKVLLFNIFMAAGKVPYYVKRKDSRYLECIKIPEYAEMPKGNKGMQFIGRTSNLLIAEYVYDFLSREFERLWKQHQEETGKAAYAKLDFYQGLYHGLNERLTDERRRQEREVTAEQRQQFAVVKVNEDQALREYVCHEFPSIGHATGSYRERRDVDSYAEGRSAGANVNIRPAVNQGRGIKALKG